MCFKIVSKKIRFSYFNMKATLAEVRLVKPKNLPSNNVRETNLVQFRGM
jgi:hypothetical protein